MLKRALIPAASLAASLAGLAFIAAYEGTGPTTTQGGQTVAHAYADPAHGWAVPTICHGRTMGVFKGQQASLEQCQVWLKEDARRECAVIARVTPVSMTQGQYDALCSFVYNVGQGAYARSTLARRINAGDCLGAAREFNRWVYAGGKRQPGLVKRRAHERAQFERDCDQW